MAERPLLGRPRTHGQRPRPAVGLTLDLHPAIVVANDDDDSGKRVRGVHAFTIGAVGGWNRPKTRADGR